MHKRDIDSVASGAKKDINLHHQFSTITNEDQRASMAALLSLVDKRTIPARIRSSCPKRACA